MGEWDNIVKCYETPYCVFRNLYYPLPVNVYGGKVVFSIRCCKNSICSQ